MDGDFKIELKTCSKKRVVVFLKVEGNKHVNADKWFANISEVSRNKFKRNFENWVGGFYEGDSERFHGWKASFKNGKYKDCFVFKDLGKTAKSRLYGYLIKRPDYTVCVLVEGATKKEDDTDFSILERILHYANDNQISECIYQHVLKGIRDEEE